MSIVSSKTIFRNFIKEFQENCDNYSNFDIAHRFNEEDISFLSEELGQFLIDLWVEYGKKYNAFLIAGHLRIHGFRFENEEDEILFVMRFG